MSLSIDGWDSHPSDLAVEDGAIPLNGLGLYHDLLLASCVGGRRISILVIPVGANDRVAEAAVTIALDPSNQASPRAIMMRAVADCS